MLYHAIRELEQGVYLRYQLDGSLFDLRRLTAKIKTVKKTVLEALFADDCAIMAHRESDLQIIVNKFAEASCLFGLTISLGKTKVLFQPAPAAVAHRPTISIHGTQLKMVEDFKYLGSVISSDRSLDKEIRARICKASQAPGCLKTRVLNQHIRQSTKLKVYRAVVLTSLLYGCETWTLYRRHLKQLEHFYAHSLQTILNIKWQDRVSNLQVFDMAEATSIEAMILKSRLRWVGHVIRMEDNRPKQLMFGELASGKQKQGRLLKRFKDCVKASISHPEITLKELELCAHDRTGWRALTKHAMDTFEERLCTQIEEARERRKLSADASGNPRFFPCPHCPRTCKSWTELHSNLHAHGRQEQRWRALSSISMDYY